MLASSYLDELSQDPLLPRKIDGSIHHRCEMVLHCEGHPATATEVHHQEEEALEVVAEEAGQMTTAMFQGGHIPGRGHPHDAAAETGHIRDHLHARHQEDEEAHQLELHLVGEGAQATVHTAATAGVVAGPGLVVEIGVVAEAVEEGRPCKMGLHRMLRSSHAFGRARDAGNPPNLAHMIPVAAALYDSLAFAPLGSTEDAAIAA
jgi:hypothetical protein